MNANANSNYTTHCDPKTGLCTAKLKVSRGRAYSIGKERMSPQMVERVEGANSVRHGALGKSSLPLSDKYLGMGFNIDIREIDKAKRVVPFIASTAAVDRYGDIIEQAGWQLDNYKKNPIVLFAHDSHALPIGKAVNIGKLDGSLFVLLEFMTADIYPLADQVFKMLCGGFLNTLSVGFIPLEYRYRFEEAKDGEEVNPWPIGAIYEKCELLENSVVPVPANPEALVVGRSYKMIYDAFERTEVEEFKNPKTKEESLMWARQASERSFFVLAKHNVISKGSVSPVDTKEVDADPYLLVSGNKFYATIKAGSEENAISRAIEKLNEYANLGMHEAFLCEVIGSDDAERPVYRSLFLISKESKENLANNMCTVCSKNHGAAQCDKCKANAAKDQKAAELEAKDNAAVDKKFSKQSANNKVQKAATAVARAHREITECHDEYCSMLAGVHEMMDAMAEECMKSVDPASSKIGEGTLKDHIENCYDQTKEIKREVIRSVNRFRGHMNRAIEHMKSVCDFADSEENPEADDPEEGDQPNDKPAKVTDGESTSEKPNADAEAAAGTNVEDSFLAEVNKLATNSKGTDSKVVDSKAGAPPAVQVGSASNAQIDAEFEALLTDLNKQ